MRKSPFFHLSVSVLLTAYLLYFSWRSRQVSMLHPFCLLWALAELSLAVFQFRRSRNRERVSSFLRICSGAMAFFYILLSAVVVCYIGLYVQIFQESGHIDPPAREPQYVLILGAQLQDEQMNEHLYARLHVLLEHLDEFPVDRTTFIVSGGTGRGQTTHRTEASCMYEYLTANGIPEERLIREEAAVSTYENLKFTEKFWQGSRLTVISSDYHLPRIYLILRDMGYEDYRLIGAPTARDILPYWALQEALGLLAWKVGIY